MITSACERYNRYIFPILSGYSNSTKLSNTAEVTTVDIKITSRDETLQIGIDESYSLVIAAPSPVIKINAQTVYGALRALETLSQIFDYNSDLKLYVGQSVSIDDKPRYPWRGLLIDTSRHYLPVDFIKTHVIEALAHNRMNVLHWHLVDAQSWPVVIPEYPLLADKGAFAPEAVYTSRDIADIVEYGRQRGVNVVPEIDVPGHSYAIGKGYPDLVAHCPSYQANINNIPVNPTLSGVYDLLRSVLSTLGRVMPNSFVHTGGDELVTKCWLEDAQIMKWCADHGVATMGALEGYFEENLQAIVRDLGKTMVVWEEAWLEKQVRLDKSVVVEAWRSIEALHQIVAAGYRGILAAPWYLDKQIPSRQGATHYFFYDTWKDYYTPDPAVSPKGVPVPPKDASLIMGGEAAMWSEQIDEGSFDERVWPRASAVAERLWSPASVNNLDEAAPRLNTQSCRMKRRGILSGPIMEGTYCPMYS